MDVLEMDRRADENLNNTFVLYEVWCHLVGKDNPRLRESLDEIEMMIHKSIRQEWDSEVNVIFMKDERVLIADWPQRDLRMAMTGGNQRQWISRSNAPIPI